MKVLVFMQTIITLSSAHQLSLLSDCSQYQPFEVVRDNGGKSAPVENNSANNANNNQSDIEFFLYNRDNPESPQDIFLYDSESVERAQYDKSLPLTVIVHGWFGSSSTGSAKTIKSSFFHNNNKRSSNVLVLDWSGLAKDESYTSAPAKVPYVGQKLSEFLNWLLNITSGRWEKIHLIGYDLGAHVVGHAGRMTGGNIGRITGLDPISPCFKETDSSLRKSDAKYVEVIHTDCAFIRSLGIILPIGDVDFYPNNCKVQPGCEDYICSHTRAYELFAASVVYNHFKGIKCNNIWDALKAMCNNTDTLVMGNDDYDKRGTGIYSLITTSSIDELSSTGKTRSVISGLQWTDNDDQLTNTEVYSKLHNKNMKWAEQVVSRNGEDVYNNIHISQANMHKFPLFEVLPTIGKDFWGKG